ncbi:Hypothetical predicted protein [Octopus vulgaris]|uniref:Methyltransferase-like protein 24 n=1 Tax=Octopus vulgaris TaxID=6645 RepID=A0AA36B5W5_OCTVU|nr:Hypothetical predicted protein [Octopus vulgaris]
MVIPPLEELKTKTEMELEDIYHGFVNIVQVKCTKIVRIGTIKDGGWIGWDSSFDVAMKNIFGCEVHSFDPFEKKIPNRELLNFHDIGISDKSGIHGGRQFMTLRDTRKHLNHTNRDISILKMDVEKAEWPSLTKAMSDGELNHVIQIAVEFHLTRKASFFIDALEIIRNLMDSNFLTFTLSFSHKMPPKKRSRLGRHTAAATVQKAIIANESSDKKTFRLSQSALRSAQSRATENLQQRNARLAKMASYDAASRASEGPETRSKRMAINASAVAAQRTSEDPQQRATRLATNAAATAASTFRHIPTTQTSNVLHSSGTVDAARLPAI